jgi:hypothetical protein
MKIIASMIFLLFVIDALALTEKSADHLKPFLITTFGFSQPWQASCFRISSVLKLLPSSKSNASES